MTDVFISHVEEDSEIAIQFATTLEADGYSTWYYERDSLPGRSYLIQIGEAIDACRAILLIISTNSLGSHQVTKEVVRGHEADKAFIPILVDVSHVEFQNRQPEWRTAVGAAASIRIPDRGTGSVAERIINGLCALGIVPSDTNSSSEVSDHGPTADADRDACRLEVEVRLRWIKNNITRYPTSAHYEINGGDVASSVDPKYKPWSLAGLIQRGWGNDEMRDVASHLATFDMSEEESKDRARVEMAIAALQLILERLGLSEVVS